MSISYRRNQPVIQYVPVAQPPATTANAPGVGAGPSQWGDWVHHGRTTINQEYKQQLASYQRARPSDYGLVSSGTGGAAPVLSRYD